MTIRTHVNNLKVSFVSLKQLNLVIEGLKAIYEEITVHDESSHDYLGMIMTHNVADQIIEIDMKKYIRECIKKFIRGT